MIRLVYFVALVTLSSAQFQPQPSGRILESPNPALCAQSKSPYLYITILLKTIKAS